MEIIKYYDKKEGWQLVNTTEETYKVSFKDNDELMYSTFITGNSLVRLPYFTEFDYKDVEMTFEEAKLKETKPKQVVDNLGCLHIGKPVILNGDVLTKKQK